MDLDDLDDPFQAPSQAPQRKSKFAPKFSKLQPQLKPKPGPPPSNPDSQGSASKVEPPVPVPAAKLEPQNASIAEKYEQENKPNVNAPDKAEPSVSHGSTDMEIDAKTEVGAVSEKDNSSDVAREVGMEEEDTVVREIDVFFTPSIDADTQLYVMQYPLRAKWRPYELDERCKEIRVKPASAEVEIDLSIDDSMNWDHGFSDKVKMTKQRLASTWKPPAADSLAVGVLIGDKLYLNPVHAVVQLRPSMEHLNAGGPKRKSSSAHDAEVNSALENSNDVKPIGASKKQNKRVELANELISDAECWIPLKYHGSNSDSSSRYREKMVAKESVAIDFTINPYDYMISLCPGPSNNNNKPRAPSRKVLLSLPVEERFKRLLLEEPPPVRRFSALRHFAHEDSIENVLEALEKHGRLVQGLWVPKTQLVLPNPNENVKAMARNYVLALFNKSLLIDSKQLGHFPMKFKEELKRFLNIFAEEITSSQQWKFKERRDESFIEEYPQIVKKQSDSWEIEKAKLNDHFQKSGKSRLGMKNAATMKPFLTHPSVQPLKSEKSTTKFAGGVIAKRTITNETREALWKALPKVFQNHKVCSFQLICQGLRDLAVSQSTLPKADPRIAVAAASGADAPPEELQEVISEVATNIHGLYVLKSSPNYPEYDPLRKVVIDLLLARGPNAKLKRAEVLEAANLILKREIPNNEYNKVMNDFCETKGAAWMLKSGDGKPS